MEKPTKILDLFSSYREVLDKELKDFFKNQRKYDMYKHMAYFMGFLDEDLKEIEAFGGKRFRSSFTLLIADFYNNLEATIAVAMSVEIFHNFTLIHDDIVDKDTMRRGRPTVWKLWGHDHAINTGDAQLILAHRALTDSKYLDAQTILNVQTFLDEKYLEVTEGQYLDFSLTEVKLDDSIVTVDNYMEMIIKKTAVLVGAAIASAGIAKGVSKEEVQELYNYGLNIGIAYQLQDDMSSLWSGSEVTGKMQFNDIATKKKTLPVLYALTKLADKDKEELINYYNSSSDIKEEDARTIVSMIESVGGYDYMKEEVGVYSKKAEEALSKLSFTPEQKDQLSTIGKTLLSL